MHARAVGLRGLPDLLVERRIGKCADRQQNQIRAVGEHLSRDRLDHGRRGRFDHVIGFLREQFIDVRASRAAGLGRQRLRGFLDCGLVQPTR